MSRRNRRRRLNIRSNQRANARAVGNALAINLFNVNEGRRRR
ncbi:hypothetical protein P4H71_12895 [Paenibacillus kribbensis]|nr:hypothetical protein [Paenibacillus kribbensis]MEC0235221.1 hypothetical protein [Paenibacillus kribbensis]